MSGFHPSGIACPTVPFENFPTSITEGLSAMTATGALSSTLSSSSDFIEPTFTPVPLSEADVGRLLLRASHRKAKAKVEVEGREAAWSDSSLLDLSLNLNLSL